MGAISRVITSGTSCPISLFCLTDRETEAWKKQGLGLASCLTTHTKLYSQALLLSGMSSQPEALNGKEARTSRMVWKNAEYTVGKCLLSTCRHQALGSEDKIQEFSSFLPRPDHGRPGARSAAVSTLLLVQEPKGAGLQPETSVHSSSLPYPAPNSGEFSTHS